MPATFTVTSGSERVVHIYPDTTERTSSGSASRSRGTRSSVTSSEESWSEIDEIDEDDIDPSDSASRGHPTSRRHHIEARPAPTRRASSRRGPLPAERERARLREEHPPRRHSSRRQHVSRHDSHESRTHRSSSRRVPSDESSSTVASSDDYPPQPYGHPGAMSRSQYPPQPAYRHMPAGYPPSMTAGGPSPYVDPYAPPHQALVHMQRPDPFGYPQQPNPFGPQSQQQNPFSPMSSQDSSSYFATDAMGPPPRQHRPDAPQRPQSFIAPPSHYGSEIMAPYHPQPYGPYAGMPYPPYGPPMHGWSPPAAASPPPPPPAATAPPPAAAPPAAAPAPPEKNPEIEALKDMLKIKIEADDHGKKAKYDEIEELKNRIKAHEAAQIKRENEWVAIREAEAAARAAEKAKIEEEKKRQQELADARKKAKEDAESKAADAAKKAKEEHEAAVKKANDEHEAAVKKAKDEHDAKLAEAEKAKADLEAVKKALEEDIAKNKPSPDSEKLPIKFKDAVGRKFSFPWHICKTWKGMESLIKQAFLHVDTIGDHVHAGHYDLTGPDGEIILPQVWDTMVRPDWDITMHLWPMEEEKPQPDPIIDFGHMNMGDYIIPGEVKKKGKKDGKKAKKPSSPEPIMVPPMHHGSPPQGFHGDPFPPSMYPPGISPVLDLGEKKKSRPKSKSVKGKEISAVAAWFAGGSLNAKPAKKEDEKLEIIRSKAHPSSRNGAPQTMQDQAQCLIM